MRSDSLAGVVIADSEYPSRVAFTLLEKVSVPGHGDEAMCPGPRLQRFSSPSAEGQSSVPSRSPPWRSFVPSLPVPGLALLVPPRLSSSAAESPRLSSGTGLWGPLWLRPHSRPLLSMLPPSVATCVFP